MIWGWSIRWGSCDGDRQDRPRGPSQAWRPALDSDGEARDGAQVAELTAWLPEPVHATRPGPQTWPDGMRVIARREIPHPGAQLRLTDEEGWRINSSPQHRRSRLDLACARRFGTGNGAGPKTGSAG